MDFAFSWELRGVVIEARELTSEKNTKWRGYVVKIATLGTTAEVQTSADLFKLAAQGSPVRASGRFEDNKGVLRLIATNLVATNSGKGA